MKCHIWFTLIKDNRGKSDLSQYVQVALSGRKGYVQYTVALKEAFLPPIFVLIFGKDVCVNLKIFT